MKQCFTQQTSLHINTDLSFSWKMETRYNLILLKVCTFKYENYEKKLAI